MFASLTKCTKSYTAFYLSTRTAGRKYIEEFQMFKVRLLPNMFLTLFIALLIQIIIDYKVIKNLNNK